MDSAGIRDLDAVVERLAGAATAAGCDVRRLGVAEPPSVDLDAALARALAHPVASPRLRDLAGGRRNAVIITSDATRPVPTRDLLGPVMDELAAGGIDAADVDVVIGGGAHRRPYPAEIVSLLGGDWAARLRVRSHDHRAADLVDLGRTPAGTPLSVDRVVAAADLRVSFGQVEPHEFAGFTGGRKSILPAVTGEAGIRANHALANLRHPKARPGMLDGNPIHEDMLAAARLARLDFIVNVALGGELEPLAVAAGDPFAAHTELTDFVRGFARLEPPGGPVDVVVTGPGAPLDIDLYQSVKPLVGLQPMVEAMAAKARADAGVTAAAPAASGIPGDAWRPPVVVLVSSCWDGVGSPEMVEPFEGASAPEEVLARLDGMYTPAMNESFNIARFLTVCPDVVACCPGVPGDDLRRLFLTPADTPEEALDTALATAAPAGRGRRPTVLLFPRAHRALFPVPTATP